MTELCQRKAAKAKFDVYPAYANAYASKICGKIKDPSVAKRKDFKGRKPSAMGGVKLAVGGLKKLLID